MECEQMMGGGKTRKPVRKCTHEAVVKFKYDGGCVKNLCQSHAFVASIHRNFLRKMREEDRKKELVRQFESLSIERMEALLA